jgi:hypothetical protein
MDSALQCTAPTLSYVRHDCQPALTSSLATFSSSGEPQRPSFFFSVLLSHSRSLNCTPLDHLLLSLSPAPVPTIQYLCMQEVAVDIFLPPFQRQAQHPSSSAAARSQSSSEVLKVLPRTQVHQATTFCPAGTSAR